MFPHNTFSVSWHCFTRILITPQVEQVKVLIAGNVELETILAYLHSSM